MEKMNHFCTHIRAALACYVDMTPEQQALATMYAARKINTLHALHMTAKTPGGVETGAGELLQKMQQLDATHQKE
jgi:hypothetical protein